MRSLKVIPVMVFDGGKLPAKLGQERKREEFDSYNYCHISKFSYSINNIFLFFSKKLKRNRQKNLEKAKEFERNHENGKAEELFKSAVDVTPEIAYTLIAKLKQQNVECIVAPYEADAQLAYLARTGYVAAVITEDSDLIPYQCPRILFKIDKQTGNCDELVFKDLFDSKANITRNLQDPKKQSQKMNISSFTEDMLRIGCILTGCDYLDSIKGIGLKKAFQRVKRSITKDKVLNFLNFNLCFFQNFHNFSQIFVFKGVGCLQERK